MGDMSIELVEKSCFVNHIYSSFIKFEGFSKTYADSKHMETLLISTFINVSIFFVLFSIQFETLIKFDMAVWYDVERAFPLSLDSRDTNKLCSINQCDSNSLLNEVMHFQVVFTIIFNPNMKTVWMHVCLSMHVSVCILMLHILLFESSSITEVLKLQDAFF